MISRILKSFTRLSPILKPLGFNSPKILAPCCTRYFSDAAKDRLFESVRYTVDTRGLNYMHVLKESSQWNEFVVQNKKPVVVCFYAT